MGGKNSQEMRGRGCHTNTNTPVKEIQLQSTIIDHVPAIPSPALPQKNIGGKNLQEMQGRGCHKNTTVNRNTNTKYKY